MDFDDLDEFAPVVETRQAPTGAVLEWIERTRRVPGLGRHLHILPDSLQKQLPPHVLRAAESSEVREKTAKVRLLCVHGVADSYKQEWFAFEGCAPPEIDVAVHEFPGHGHRDAERVPSTIAELVEDAFEAFRPSMETGSFALLGHSIGCLIVVEIAKRAERELNVKPVVVFMVERGACQWPLFTEKGLAAMRDVDFQVSLDLSAGDAPLDLREKELDVRQGSETALIINNPPTCPVMLRWNLENPGHEIRQFDEIIRVDGKPGTACDMHLEIRAATARRCQSLKLDLRRRAYDFLKIHSPGVAAMLNNGPSKSLDRWTKTWLCENDTLEIGYHSFMCPLIAISAQTSVDATVKLKDLPPHSKTVIESGHKVFNKDLGDGTAFLGHFPARTFDDWKAWTENDAGFKVVECLDCDHMTIKANKTFRDTVYGTLSDLVKLWTQS